MGKNHIDGDAFNKLSLVRQFDEYKRAIDNLLEHNCEEEFLKFAIQMEAVRKKWNECEVIKMDQQEELTKLRAEKDALLVKLKLAREQIGVEMERKQKAEQERDELDHQLVLVRELLYTDSSVHPTLSDEQHKKLDFLNQTKYREPNRSRARPSHQKLAPIDETGSFLDSDSDISFDRTTDDLDSSQSSNRFKRSHTAAMQRAHINAGISSNDEITCKRIKADKNESIHCQIDGPATLKVTKLDKSFNRAPPHQGRRRPSREHRRKSGTSETDTGAESSDFQKFWPQQSAPKVSGFAKKSAMKPTKQHNLVLKQCVIMKDTCKPCGKRIAFGKKAWKCQDCRVVAHQECKKQLQQFKCELSNSPNSKQAADLKRSIEEYLHSGENPQIPPIIYHTVQEIERRGMREVGLYRVPGSLREVKELQDEFLSGGMPKFSQYNDVHSLCSLVKKFLRDCIDEPILTYALRENFIRAARSAEEHETIQAISELPPANRDTLVFLMLHLQRVIDIPDTRMGVEGMSKAIGPSFVGYASNEPNLDELQRASNEQVLVLTSLLNMSSDYYSAVLDKAMRSDENLQPQIHQQQNVPITTSNDSHLQLGAGNLLGSVYSPKKTTSSSSLAERAKKYLGMTPKNKNKGFFGSPY